MLDRQRMMRLPKVDMDMIERVLEALVTPGKIDDSDFVRHAIIDHLYISEKDSDGKHDLILLFRQVYTPMDEVRQIIKSQETQEGEG